jgi:hypothetical protein
MSRLCVGIDATRKLRSRKQTIPNSFAAAYNAAIQTSPDSEKRDYYLGILSKELADVGKSDAWHWRVPLTLYLYPTSIINKALGFSFFRRRT